MDGGLGLGHSPVEPRVTHGAYGNLLSQSRGRISMKSAFKAIAVIALATSSLVSAARAADSIVGTWRLVSWTEEETESKAVHKNFGDHPSGLVTFTSDG